MEVKTGYKQTEVGVIPEAWECTTVRGIASKARNAIVGGPFGSDLVSKDYVEFGVPIIRGQNMSGQWVSGNFAFVSPAKAKSLEANLARPGDVVFTQRGTLGQVSLVPDAPFDSYLVSQSQMKLSVNRQIADPLFYFYVFTSEDQQELIRGGTIQTGVPHINLGILRDIPVQLPPPPEQRAIATALSDIDALLRGLDRLITKKRDLKQAAMQQLLTGQTRLPGFDRKWELATFNGVLTKLNAKGHQIQTSEYLTTGTFPVVDQGQKAIVGFSDRKDKRFQCPQEGVVIFGDHTCIVKFVNFDLSSVLTGHKFWSQKKVNALGSTRLRSKIGEYQQRATIGTSNFSRRGRSSVHRSPSKLPSLRCWRTWARSWRRWRLDATKPAT